MHGKKKENSEIFSIFLKIQKRLKETVNFTLIFDERNLR